MRVGAVIAAAGKSGGYKSYDKMKSVDGIQVLRQMILNFKRAGVDEIVLITGYQAEQVEKKLAKLGAVFLRSEDYEKEEMITSAVRGMNYLKPRCEKFFFCPAGVSLFTEDTVRVLMQKAKENENDQEKVYVPVWEERKGHPILMDRSMIDQFASYEGEGGLKGAMDALNVERIFVPVEDNGVAIYSGQGESFREIFKEKEKERRIRPRVKLQLEKNENFFGPGIVFLLRQIDTLGSVRDACAKTGMSYSKGWKTLQRISDGVGTSVVSSSQGGIYGGSTSLTEKGEWLLERFSEFGASCRQFADDSFEIHFSN